MTLEEHIKKQKEECLKCEVNSKKYMEHWDLLNYLIELKRLKEENRRAIDLLYKNELLRELYK